MKSDIEAPDLFIEVSSPKKCLLRNIVETTHTFRVVRRNHPSADLQSILIDDNAVAVNNVHFGMLPKVAPDIAKRPGHEAVVRIQISHDLAMSIGKALDDRVGLSLIPFAYRISKMRSIFLQYLSLSRP